MNTRKIQLIAGTTYSITLPKEWVKRNGLKEGNELIINENADMTLALSPRAVFDANKQAISINIEDYLRNIGQLLFSAYYAGVEEITLISKKDIEKKSRAKIKKTITHMSGTEIMYEDARRITVKVLLDKSKLNINQVIYRMFLLIDLSIQNLRGELNIDDIRINENEIDRLYHLLAKIITLSLTDPNMLHSSQIKSVSLVPSYFLIGKKLENIGDNINHLSLYLEKNKVRGGIKDIFWEFILKQFKICTKHLLGEKNEIPIKASDDDIQSVKNEVSKIGDTAIKDYLEGIIRFTIDLEEELINIQINRQLFLNKK